MDYLYQAIEKARRKREGKIGLTQAPGNTFSSRPRAESAIPVESAEAAVEEPKKSPPKKMPLRRKASKTLPAPSKVRYSSTRVVELETDDLRHNRVIAGETDDPRVEAYRQLRSQVLSTMKRHDSRTLAITSAHKNAGKTLTAVNLAISMSLELNQTVMLVDLDLREPSVHTTLKIEIDQGIVDHLQHGEPIENILLNPGYPRLVVLPGLPQGRHSSELLTSPEMKSFLEDITTRYPDRIIIFDLPPLLRNDDAMAFVPKVDACLLVVEEGVTTPSDIQRSMQLLKHAKLIGTILNKVR